MIYRTEKQFCIHGHDTFKLGREKVGDCSECRRIKSRKYKLDNRSEVRAQEKQYRKENKEKIIKRERQYKRAKRYGITIGYYDFLVKSQNNRCAICNSKSLKRALAIDHNHKTGKVRGLLCHNCNIAIGMVKEKQDILKSIIKYLRIRK